MTLARSFSGPERMEKGELFCEEAGLMRAETEGWGLKNEKKGRKSTRKEKEAKKHKPDGTQ